MFRFSLSASLLDVAVIPVTHELLSLNKQSNITQLLSIQELLQS